MVEVKASIDLLQRLIIYCVEAKSVTMQNKVIYSTEKDISEIRYLLGHGRKGELIKSTRKEMLKISVDVEFWERILDYIDEFKENCSLATEYVTAQADTIRVKKFIRQYKKRDKKERKLFKLNVKEINQMPLLGW